MDLIIQIVLLIVGFVLLIKGADYFVDGASNVANILKIPAVIVGLTIVALGTSAPEAAVSVLSSLSGSNELALSNVIGSNIFNILGVIGCCASLATLKVDENILKRDYPFLLVATILSTVLIVLTWSISRLIGIVFLICIIAYISVLVTKAKKSKEGTIVKESELSLVKCIIFIVGGLAGIIIGGQLVVDSAKAISLAVGMSETLVGLTIVSIGTSLPELVTSINGLRKGHTDLVIGNVVGSNIFNILFILGLSGLISPITVDPSMLVDLILLLVITVIGFIFGKTGHKYTRKEGILLLIIFVIYMAFVIIRN